jgi:protein SCO1
LPDSVSWLRTAAASLVFCAAGGALFASGTDGFRALTTEQARRLAIEQSPRAIPAVALEDQDGHPFALGDYRGRAVAVNFVYTQCASVCGLLSSGFQLIHEAATDPGVQLVSISFDPRDTPSRLSEYGSHFGADGRSWRFARVRDTTDIPMLLKTFGIVVIPDGNGDFQHNAAVHVIDAKGRLSRVLDADASPEDVARAASRR